MMYNIKHDKELAKEFNEVTIKTDRDKHIVNNIPLAIKIASKFFGYSDGYYDDEDIVQLSCMGIIKAIDRYKFNKGAKFSTYMSLWCQQYIRRFKYESSMIKIPEYLMTDFIKIKILMNEGESFDNAVNKLNLQKDKFIDLIELTNVSSIDYSLASKDSGEINIIESIDSGINIENDYIKKVNNEELLKAIDRLSDEDKFIIQEVYFNNKKIAELAEILGVKRTTLSMRRNAALKRLRNILENL